MLGPKASEATVKAMRGSGALASHKVVAFATHGLVAGQLKGLAEPAIALTIPATASETDDGPLTASEAAALKLDADVSHWEVESSAAVRLTSGTFAALKADPSLGRAGAFRQSMLDLIDKGHLTRPTPPTGRRSLSSARVALSGRTLN